MIGTNFDPLEENLPQGWLLSESTLATRQPSIDLEEDELYHARFTRLQAEREAKRERESSNRMKQTIEKERNLRRQAEAEIRRLQAMLHSAGIDPLKYSAC